MSLGDFLREEKEARKARRLEKKQQKRASKTKEQKFYKFAGVIVGILVTIGALMSVGSAFDGDFDIGETFGITNEMIAAIEQPVDENLLFDRGRILESDLYECKEILDDAGANLLDSNKEELVAEKTFYLNSKQLGALVNELISSDELQIQMYILDLQIFKENDCFYEKTITQIDLNSIVDEKSLPKVYLISVSKIEVLGDQIKILDTDMHINLLDDEMNDQFIKLLGKYNNFNLVNASNEMVNMAVDIFASSVNTKVFLKDNGIEFRV